MKLCNTHKKVSDKSMINYVSIMAIILIAIIAIGICLQGSQNQLIQQMEIKILENQKIEIKINKHNSFEVIRRNLSNQNKNRQKQKDTSSEQTKYIFGWTKQQLIHAITIFVIVLVSGVVLICAICLCIYIVKSHRKQAKQNIDFNLIFPSIPYSSFVADVGYPLQSECAICLQQFIHKYQNVLKNEQNNIRNSNQGVLFSCTLNQNEEYQQSKSNKVKQIKLYINDDQNSSLVKFTYCGHLLHSKCLNQWLQRQHNCPMCRQPFTTQKIQAWQNKVGLNYEEEYQRQQQLLRSANEKNEGGSQNIIIDKQFSNSVQNQNTYQNINHFLKQAKMYKYASNIYRKLMKYHRKDSQENTFGNNNKNYNHQIQGSCLSAQLHFEQDNQS